MFLAIDLFRFPSNQFPVVAVNVQWVNGVSTSWAGGRTATKPPLAPDGGYGIPAKIVDRWGT
jgi:hypothetical protein